MSADQVNLLKSWEKHSLLGVVAFLDRCDPSNDETFAKVIDSAVGRFGLSASAIAEEFEIDRSTVNRWAGGKTKPHHLVRPIIVRWIRDQLSSQAEELTKAPADIGELEDFADRQLAI